MEDHTRADGILVHTRGNDHHIKIPAEPDHQTLCDTEQAFVLKAIEQDLNLERHMNDAVQSLRICLAADQSIRTKKTVELGDIL